MGKNIIVSEDTVRDLVEAHASLSAWYYELWSALRRANASSNAPDDAARAAFVERIATDFPEIASVARAIRIPRLFVPPPPIIAVPPNIVEGAAESGAPPPEAPGPGAPPDKPAPPQAAAPRETPEIAPPAMVIPSEVKYER